MLEVTRGMTKVDYRNRFSKMSLGFQAFKLSSFRFFKVSRYLGLVYALLFCYGTAQEAYYPATPGLTWTYSNGETQSLSGPRDFSGQSALVLLHSLQGAPATEDYIVYDDSGGRLLGTAVSGEVVSYTPPLLVYPPSPLQVGQTWSSTTQVQGLEITLSAEVLGVGGVQTPAGRFNALQIRQQTITSSGGQTFIDQFFVPTVGIVRTVTQDGTTIDLIEKNF